MDNTIQGKRRGITNRSTGAAGRAVSEINALRRGPVNGGVLPLKQLMQNEFSNPYHPFPPEVDAKTKRVTASFPIVNMVSLSACIVSGILFVGAMHVANYDGQTVVLMMAGSALLLLSIIVWFLKLRTIVPMFTLFPFCFVVVIRHVGDMGPMHHIDGGLYLVTVLIFFCSLVFATATKFGLAIHRRRS